MELQGKLKVINDTKSFGTNGFQKREVVITTSEQYPQHISIDFTQDKCLLLDSYKIGQDVKIGINIGGRQWENPQGETKYFNSITGWRIDDAAGEKTAPFEAAPSTLEEPSDDLPFN